ncbi:hypothetical protein BDN70DRAFT_925648 [Pholiota conissans]|uniref:Uncharacterized protein n=1 Tax=Pholiota conissans TaxID=109636 RepID=A0A9P5YNR7_9AGAR|nr:hypothetical protein BDN70DRAFT_925648 [Pholiota conissans]
MSVLSAYTYLSPPWRFWKKLIFAIVNVDRELLSRTIIKVYLLPKKFARPKQPKYGGATFNKEQGGGRFYDGHACRKSYPPTSTIDKETPFVHRQIKAQLHIRPSSISTCVRRGPKSSSEFVSVPSPSSPRAKKSELDYMRLNGPQKSEDSNTDTASVNTARTKRRRANPSIASDPRGYTTLSICDPRSSILRRQSQDRRVETGSYEFEFESEFVCLKARRGE